jgi:choice-of-anchor B domain-containing protein
VRFGPVGLVLGLVLPPVGAGAQGVLNTELLSRYDTGDPAYAAVGGYTAPDGTELAILATISGTAFVNVTDPRQPKPAGFVPGELSNWREVATHSHYAYIVSEGGGGMQIVDLADPSMPLLVGAFDSTFTSAHTVQAFEGFAYVNGSRRDGEAAGMRILDLADPEHPVDVGAWTARYVHDSYVRGSLAYLATISSGGFSIVNVGDKSNPYEVSFTPYSGAAAHNCWLNDDGRYLLTTDETSGGHLRVWDVANPGAPFQVAEWQAHPTASIHNVAVKGDSAYMSYYTEGLHVLDISDPRVPIPVAWYDTYAGASGGYRGNWGVWPFARNGAIYLSDIGRGLFVVGLTEGEPVADFVVEAPESQVALPQQTQVQMYFELYNGAGTAAAFDLWATNSQEWQMSSPADVYVHPSSTELVPVTVLVPAGLAGPTHVEVELCVTSRRSHLERCVRSELAVPVVLESFEAQAGDDAVTLRWSLAVEGDAGEALLLQRSEAGGPFGERARLEPRSGEHRDAAVRAGVEYRYRLVLQRGGEAVVLGERAARLAAPARSHLLGNAPNPFNPSTRVRFDLARGGEVRLAIYDLRGRLVRSEARSGLAAGRHEILWDGADGHGRPQPSGVYFYEVRSGGWRARGRMTLAR